MRSPTATMRFDRLGNAVLEKILQLRCKPVSNFSFLKSQEDGTDAGEHPLAGMPPAEDEQTQQMQVLGLWRLHM